MLEVGRLSLRNPYGMTGLFTPKIPRDLRREVAERMDAKGRIVTPLDKAEPCQNVTKLAEMGCESLVIHFLHAYGNPARERHAAEIALEV